MYKPSQPHDTITSMTPPSDRRTNIFEPAFVRREPDTAAGQTTTVKINCPDDVPEQSEPIADASNTQALPRPEPPGQVPKGWIDTGVALERLNLAGFNLKGRQVRRLCACHALENIKTRNKRNQWQIFINPTSVDAYITKNQRQISSGKYPDETRGTSPEDSAIRPDKTEPILHEEEKKSVPDSPASSGQATSKPDNNPDSRTDTVQLAIAKERIFGLETMIAELREDKQHLRDELKQANELRHHVLTLAQGAENISKEMLETLRSMAIKQTLPEPPVDQPPVKMGWRDGDVG